MPELPEVETVANDLREQLTGRRFSGEAGILWHRTLATPGPELLPERLAGQKVIDVGRRGKFVKISLSNGDTLLIHLRMTGKLTVVPAKSPALDDVHVRAWFGLTDGEQLVFTDARKFGRVWLVRDVAEVTGRLGPEPLDWQFTPEVLGERMRKRRVAIKTLLLDQTALAGIGNIYADEALYRAHIHPQRSSATLNDDEIRRLHAALREVLLESIGKRGTMLRDYRTPYGSYGAFQEELRVYGRPGEPCPHCGTPIERIRVTQRSTHFCPKCQCLP
jgi:formamidopyrimidine-DNA glycosylase